MGMDRNTVIGFVLIGALLIGMFYFNSKGRIAYEAEQKRIADSIARTSPKIDPLKAKSDSLQLESARKIQSAGDFKQAVGDTEQLAVVENEVLKVTFTN